MKSRIREKNSVLPIKKFTPLALHKHSCHCTVKIYLLPFFYRNKLFLVPMYYSQSNGRLPQLLALKVVAVTYERWSLTIGSKYSDLTSKLLVSLKTGQGEGEREP